MAEGNAFEGDVIGPMLRGGVVLIYGWGSAAIIIYDIHRAVRVIHDDFYRLLILFSEMVFCWLLLNRVISGFLFCACF